MAQEFSRHIYSSARWRHLADQAMRRYETTVGSVPPGLCERCYQHGILANADLVHHIVPITPANVGDPSVTLNADNLMRLCRDCHAAVHSNDQHGPLRWTIGPDGRLRQR